MSTSRVDQLLVELDAIEERRRDKHSDKWSEAEDKKFIKSIRSQFPNKEYLKEEITEDIDWDLVSEATNRSIPKCRKQWFKRIRVKLINEQLMTENQMKSWNHLYDTSRLISLVYDNKYSTEEDIDWDYLKEKFQKLITYNDLMRVWRNLKTSVPQSGQKSFKEIIDWLYRNKTCDEIVLSDDEI